MLYVINQLVSCAHKVKTGIVNKKGPAERYRYKSLPVWNCPTFCRMVWGGLSNAFYTATATFYTDPDTFQNLPDYFENITCDIARDRPGMINHFLTPSIQRASRGDILDNELVEYTGDWELDRMEFSRALARDITYAESDIDRDNIVEQQVELFVYEKWRDKDVKVQNPTVRVFNRGDTTDQLAAAYSRIDVAVTSAQLDNQLCALDDLFGSEVSEEVNLLRIAIATKPSMYVAASDDKTITGDLVKEAGDSDPSMLQPQSTSSADSAVSASKLKKPLRKKHINNEDGDEGDQDNSPSSKRHKSAGEELSRTRPANKTKKSGLADALQGDSLLQFRSSDGSRDPSSASQESNQFKITMEKSVRDLKEQVTDKFSALTSEVTGIREGLAKASKRSDTAIANETAKVLELTTRVVRQSDEIAKLNRRVSLLEEEIKIRASNDKKIEALEARITSQINAAVSAAVLAATAQSSLDIVVPSAKAPKKHVTIAPIATSSSQQQGLETPMRNQHSVLPQRMSICNRPPPASFRGNTVDNVTMSSRTPISSVPVGRVPLTTLQSGVGTTPFIGQAAGMGRFGARVLPGRGNN